MTKANYKTGGTAGKAAGSCYKGIATAAGAIGKAIGIFGRIRIFRPRGSKDKKKLGWARKRKAVQQSALEVEIARLERKLDDIYTQVVQGAGSLKRDEIASGALDLQSLMELARDLKNQLFEKRAELSRIKRDEARRSRLRQTGWQEIGLPSGRERVAPKSPKESSTSRSAPVSDKLRKAISRASTKSSFQDGAQQVIFNKVVDDLLENDPEIRRTAAARLGELGSSSAFDILVATLEDPDGRVRVAALNSLALISDSSAAQLFTRFACNADHRLRIAALRGLYRIEGAEVNLALIGGLEDEHPSVRKAAATYLGWRQEKKAAKALMRALRDDEEDVRAAAAASLGNIRDDKAVLFLMRTLIDPAQTVREKAKIAIEATLGKEIDIDIRAEDETLEQRVEEMKQWWKEARVENYFERRIGPPVPEEPMAVRQVEEEPKEEPAKVVKLRSASEARAQVGAIGKPAVPKEDASPKEPEAAEDLKALGSAQASEQVQSSVPEDSKVAVGEESSLDSQEGLDAGFGGPDGLEGLGVSVTTSDTKASEDDKKEKE